MWLGVSLCVCVCVWDAGVSLFMAERNNFHFKRICRPRPMLLFLICHFGPLPSATSVILFHPALWPFGIQNSFALLLFCHCFISSARHFSSALCEVDRGFRGIGDGGGFFFRTYRLIRAQQPVLPCTLLFRQYSSKIKNFCPAARTSFRCLFNGRTSPQPPHLPTYPHLDRHFRHLSCVLFYPSCAAFFFLSAPQLLVFN